MIKLVLLFTCILAAAFDTYITRQRLDKYGKAVEVNPWVKSAGALLAIYLPTLIIAFGLYILNWLTALSFYTGMRVELAWLQYQSIGLEKELLNKSRQ